VFSKNGVSETILMIGVADSSATFVKFEFIKDTQNLVRASIGEGHFNPMCRWLAGSLKRVF
jgi:hypothetical protein